MSIIKILICASFITCCLCGNWTGTNLTLKIVAGFDCHPKVVPYLASLQTRRHAVFCGGTLLNSLWVLTAAHCCVKSYADYSVHTGLIHLRRRFIQKSTVKRVIAHENFTTSPWSNDICLLELTKPVRENKHTKYVQLPPPLVYEHLMGNLRCNRSLSLGFGYRNTVYLNRTTEPNDPDTTLQCVFQRVMPDEYCDANNDGVDVSTMLCVHGNPGQSADTCMGDSGGPLICQGFQVGIVAAGLGCGLGYRSYFTKTASFEDFIHKYVSDNINQSRSVSTNISKLNLYSLSYFCYHILLYIYIV